MGMFRGRSWRFDLILSLEQRFGSTTHTHMNRQFDITADTQKSAGGQHRPEGVWLPFRPQANAVRNGFNLTFSNRELRTGSKCM